MNKQQALMTRILVKVSSAAESRLDGCPPAHHEQLRSWHEGAGGDFAGQ